MKNLFSRELEQVTLFCCCCSHSLSFTPPAAWLLLRWHTSSHWTHGSELVVMTRWRLFHSYWVSQGDWLWGWKLVWGEVEGQNGKSLSWRAKIPLIYWDRFLTSLVDIEDPGDSFMCQQGAGLRNANTCWLNLPVKLAFLSSVLSLDRGVFFPALILITGWNSLFSTWNPIGFSSDTAFI